MSEFLSNYLAESLIVIGLILLTTEVLILSFSTFILFFVGISLIITGTAVWIEILPATWTSILVANAILSTVLTVALWQPLKRIQNKTEKNTVKNDFIGITFFVEQAIDRQGNYQHKYSGITWQVKSEQPIPANTEVKVVKADVGTLWVTANQ
ncbi:MAG: NfeD family protein [Thalassotalea sp.]